MRNLWIRAVCCLLRARIAILNRRNTKTDGLTFKVKEFWKGPNQRRSRAPENVIVVL